MSPCVAALRPPLPQLLPEAHHLRRRLVVCGQVVIGAAGLAQPGAVDVRHGVPGAVEPPNPHTHAHILHLKQLHTKMDTGIQLFCLFGWRIHANQLQRKRSLPEASDCQIQIQCSVQYLKKLYSQVHWHNSDILLPAIPAYKKNAISGIMLLSFSIYIVNKSYVSVSRLSRRVVVHF